MDRSKWLDQLVATVTVVAIILLASLLGGCGASPFTPTQDASDFIHPLVGVWQSDNIVIEFHQNRAVEYDDGVSGMGHSGTWDERVDGYLRVVITIRGGFVLSEPIYSAGFYEITHKTLVWGDRIYTEVPTTRPHAHGE